MDAEDDSLTGGGNTTPSYDEALVKIRHIKSKPKYNQYSLMPYIKTF